MRACRVRTRKFRSRCIAIPFDAGRWYYRVYCADCSQGDVVDKLREMFDKVFHQMSMRVVVEHAFEEGSHVAETVTALREGFPNMHWAK